MHEQPHEAPLIKELDERGVLRLTMNRPDVHNAFDDHLILRLIDALDAASDNEAVRLVLLGSIGKSFSAGGDLNYMRRMGSNSYEENLKDASQLARLMKTLNFFPKPTIALVQGAAFGGAVGLISCCDIAIGTPRAKFALSEARVGMAPATIAPYVVRTIGEKAARRFFTTAQEITAEKALDLNLLSEITTEDTLNEAAESVIGALLKNGPDAVRKAKQIVFDVAHGVVSDAMVEHTVRFIADIRDSDEGREGLSAFLEKRKPNWVTVNNRAPREAL
jgi:methylglutaconyl-CoA hydratase